MRHNIFNLKTLFVLLTLASCENESETLKDSSSLSRGQVSKATYSLERILEKGCYRIHSSTAGDISNNISAIIELFASAQIPYTEEYIQQRFKSKAHNTTGAGPALRINGLATITFNHHYVNNGQEREPTGEYNFEESENELVMTSRDTLNIKISDDDGASRLITRIIRKYPFAYEELHRNPSGTFLYDYNFVEKIHAKKKGDKIIIPAIRFFYIMDDVVVSGGWFNKFGPKSNFVWGTEPRGKHYPKQPRF